MRLLQALNPSVLTWEEFLNWAQSENEYQKSRIGSHPPDHPNALLRSRTYFEVNLYRYYHALRAIWPYLTRPNQKVLDVGSWPGCFLRVMSHFASAVSPQLWATGLIVKPDFVEKMAGACAGAVRCELDVWSPMSDREAPSALLETGFTLVTAMEVVEHLYHPEWMFRILADAMADHGILFLTTNNAARWQNIVGLIKGEGMAGNLDELLPRGGGQLGAWRPHAREYVYKELIHVAASAGFAHVAHGFYQENYGLKLLEGVDRPSEELTLASAHERELFSAIRPMLAECDQLKSGMYLIFRKAGRVQRTFDQLKSRVGMVYAKTATRASIIRRRYVQNRAANRNNGSASGE